MMAVVGGGGGGGGGVVVVAVVSREAQETIYDLAGFVFSAVQNLSGTKRLIRLKIIGHHVMLLLIRAMQLCCAENNLLAQSRRNRPVAPGNI
jgi:hypothetical protein